MPDSRRGSLWRAVLAAFVIVACTAGAVATAGLLKVSSFAAGGVAAITNAGTTLPAPGKPETLLIVGSDARWGQKGESNTDTMMLVRIDDSSKTINMLSIPRDLEVTIGGQTVKLNAAWATGGSKLLINTLATQVFPGTNFHVTHILNIDFSGFGDVIDAIGCVYSMVDRRYYNINVGTVATNWSSIDLQPGYQLLCGDNGAPHSALAFVRFRHYDSDLVREARQQDFIRWAKSQFSASELENHETSLLKVFKDHVATDHNLHTTDGLIDLADLVINADSQDVKSVYFPATAVTQNGVDFLQFTTTASSAAYRRFMTPTKQSTSSSKSSSTSTSKSSTTQASTTTQPSKTSTGKKSKTSTSGSGTVWKPAAGTIAAVQAGLTQASSLTNAGIPVYYPKYIPGNSQYCLPSVTTCLMNGTSTNYVNTYPREYSITDRTNLRHSAYVMTLLFNPSVAGTGQYLNVQGTSWQDPPILTNPTSVIRENGKTLDLYYNAGQLTLVAWHTAQAVYWISNTLQGVVPAQQIITMAASLTLAR